MKNKNVAPALGRTFGFFGMMMGLVFFQVINNFLGLGVELIGFSSLGFAGWILFIISIFVGFFGMAIGLGIAINITIKSDDVSLFISCLWHFFAHGMLFWVILWGIWLRIKIGPHAQEAVMESARQIGMWKFFWLSFNWGIAASLAAGVIGWLAGDKLGIVIFWVIVAYLFGAYQQSQFYLIDSIGWIFIGIIAAVFSIILSAFMIEKDRKEREEIRNM